MNSGDTGDTPLQNGRNYAIHKIMSYINPSDVKNRPFGWSAKRKSDYELHTVALSGLAHSSKTRLCAPARDIRPRGSTF